MLVRIIPPCSFYTLDDLLDAVEIIRVQKENQTRATDARA